MVIRNSIKVSILQKVNKSSFIKSNCEDGELVNSIYEVFFVVLPELPKENKKYKAIDILGEVKSIISANNNIYIQNVKCVNDRIIHTGDSNLYDYFNLYYFDLVKQKNQFQRIAIKKNKMF